MRLWLITPVDEANGPWDPWYDKAFAFVVRDEREEDARRLASENARVEGQECWLGPLVSCVPLTDDGQEEIICSDVRYA